MAIETSVPPTGAAIPAEKLFAHTDGVARPQIRKLSSTTRYLSGAPYVDDGYADRVIDEVVADSHRAVAPAIGYDLEAVVRHCFAARRLLVAQNLGLLAILLAGLVIAPQVTIWLFGVFLALLFPGWLRRQRGRWNAWRTLLAFVFGWTAFFWVTGPLTALSGLDDSSYYAEVGTGRGWPLGQTGGSFLAIAVLQTIALLTVLTWSRQRMIRTITTDLAPGRAGPLPEVPDRDVSARLEILRTAQHGNVVLHSGFDPFLGAGTRGDAWSIALDLRPDQASRAAGSTGTVLIDPVELVRHVRTRLAALRSHQLPEQERMTGLQLRDQIIAGGARWHGYPLIDQRLWLPYSYATQEAADAIIRFPQTSARHFLRVSVGAQEKPAVAPDGETIMPSEHQSIVATTFAHFAVEGGMLYIEVVESVLGPLEQRYLDIDRYELSDGPILGTAFAEAWVRLASAVPLAPLRLLRALRRTVRMNTDMRRSADQARREPVHDFGAQAEARQLASRESFATYIQKLDSEKYLRLVSKRITESVVEFLTEHGIDASEYQRVVNFQQYNNVTIGDSFGPTAMGPQAAATAFTSTKDG